jgi:predicted nucleic acid-binding protein
LGIVRDHPERLRALISQARYPSPISPHHAIDVLARAAQTQYHEFWPCAVRVLDNEAVDPSRIRSSKQVTDAYLLALAVANGGSFVTFDQSIALATVSGVQDQHLTIL